MTIFSNPGEDRLPPIPAAAMTAGQVEAARAIAAGPRGALFGPFIPMLRSPEFMNRAQTLGAYLRYESRIPARLREFATIVTAAHWRQGYEWNVHAPLAREAGVDPATIAALERDETPSAMAPDEAAIFHFCSSLHRDQTVGDADYAAVLELLGEDGLVELVGICGYYAMLAMILNVARTPL